MSEQNTTQDYLSGVDMGFNLQVARRRKKLTQVELSERTGVRQADISDMENQEVIENEEVLTKLVNELGTTLDVIKKTRMDDVLDGKAVQYNDQSVTSASDSKDVVSQGYEFEQNFNYVTPELKAAYQALMDEKDIRIKEYQKENAELKEQLATLLKKL